MEERDLYDEHRNCTNESIKKGQKIPQGRYYITVVIWMQNSKKEFLIQKNKKYHLWSTTGGHPKAGESSWEGAVTEIKEELGIAVCAEDLKLFRIIKTEDDFVDLYYLKIDVDIDDLCIQKEEVEEVRWASDKEIRSLIKQGDFLPPHVELYEYVKMIERRQNLFSDVSY